MLPARRQRRLRRGAATHSRVHSEGRLPPRLPRRSGGPRYGDDSSCRGALVDRACHHPLLTDGPRPLQRAIRCWTSRLRSALKPCGGLVGPPATSTTASSRALRQGQAAGAARQGSSTDLAMTRPCVGEREVEPVQRMVTSLATESAHSVPVHLVTAVGCRACATTLTRTTGWCSIRYSGTSRGVLG